MAPLPVTLRTLDAGGDKKLPYLPEDDSSPALGSRGIRFSLSRPEIFLTQLRAALRADIGLQGSTAPSSEPPEVSAAVVVQQHAATPGAARA